MKASKIFWGIILIFIGAIFLLENFNIIDFYWGEIWRLWPLFLILWGVNILFNHKENNQVATLVIVATTIITLALVTFKGLNPATEKINYHRFNFEEHFHDKEEESSSYSYHQDFEDKFKTATLNISGGASQFEIKDTTQQLFVAKVDGKNNNYLLASNNDSTDVKLKFSSKNIRNFDFNENSGNEVKIKLNAQPFWNVNLKMGAGQADFDLRKFKVRNIDLKGGAAEFNIKLGDLTDSVNLNAETGVASVKIQIPQSTGCQIKNSSGLSSKEFNGFIETNKGNYETSNFNSASKKIFIVLKGGLSDLEVKRY